VRYLYRTATKWAMPAHKSRVLINFSAEQDVAGPAEPANKHGQAWNALNFKMIALCVRMATAPSETILEPSRSLLNAPFR
jgi:hypothetical protein